MAAESHRLAVAWKHSQGDPCFQQYCQHPLAADAAQRAATYFTNNQHRMDYAEYRNKGYWIGRGIVESVCKQIVTACLKTAGARWTISSAIATVKARVAWLSHGDSLKYPFPFTLTTLILQTFSAPPAWNIFALCRNYGIKVWRTLNTIEK